MRCNKNYRLSYTEQAKKIIHNLSLEEKVNLMSGVGYYFGKNETYDRIKEHYNYVPYYCGGIKEMNIPPVLFSDGSRGVVIGNGKATCFPVTMLRGATFDTKLEERIGQAIGKEVKASGCNLFAGVCINLPYHPGWGRSQETYGEVSNHIGQMGSALVRGVQEENVIACIKHFALNSMELSRYKVNVECSKRTEQEVFLPHFKECIDNGAAAVMSAYNKYKGECCCQNKYLLRTVLKEDWDFDGFVFSDFNGIKDTLTAIESGQDMEMCNTFYYGNKLVEAVKEEKVSEEKINDSALRIVRTLLAFSKEDDKVYGKSVLGCKEHIKLSLEAARKGITLIKNEENVLPFKKEKSVRIAVFGKLANTENIGDHGSSRVFPKYVVTPLQGIAKVCKNAEVVYYQGTDLDHAKSLAESSDYSVFVVGYSYDEEGEHVEGDDAVSFKNYKGGDRKNSLGLDQNEIDLIKAVGPVNKNSAVVLIGGNMIMIEEWKDYVSSILMAYYPGMEGGTAIAEILFGDVNPSGKLPFVVVKKESDLPQINWETDRQYYGYYHGFTKLEKEKITPSVPYGFGLSYTTFKVSDVCFKIEGELITASCIVENTGKLEGDEIIQFYAGFKHSSIDRPVKDLMGFQRISLKAGEKKKAVITIPLSKLYWYNEEKNSWELEHMEYEMYIGTSSLQADLIEGKLTL